MVESEFREIAELIDDDRHPEALSALDPLLEDDPEHPTALLMLAGILTHSEKHGMAYNIYRRLQDIQPKNPLMWTESARCAEDLQRLDEAERWYRQALTLDRTTPVALFGLSTIAIRRGDSRGGLKWANKALKQDSSLTGARVNRGFAQLMEGDFQGWIDYAAGTGRHKWRTKKQFEGEPVWTGEPRKSVVLYAEQGIGDQILMADAVPDAIDRCSRVVLECGPKLEGLFRRSFGVPAYRTQFVKDPEWVGLESPIDASCSLSQLQALFRRTAKAYRGKPYLIADPHRAAAARGMMVALGSKPRIGISWTGGMKDTSASERSTTLQTLLPLLQAVDATWVSLEYKDRSEEIGACPVRVYDFPWLTQTKDYDDTAGLVAALDLVISVPQSVCHLAGAMGVETWVLQSPRPHAFWGLRGDIPVYSCVHQIRRETEDWGPMLQLISEKLRRRYANL